MNGSNRVNVMKSNDFIIFIDFFAGDATRNNFAEDTVAHVISPRAMRFSSGTT
jgi:hypothetical protein